ncbi:MAG: 23S rRNA (pseudouridine(1915)-N(3))-methyltransferase RlmH [Bacteroidetes bacterium RBG_13_43_22]|nr:MAG: 23S rRNA (pseudouridine(1915)-N(3))-methyltransferase RlmH [Bacteroidetes bacterium RBG_13_43_22]
MKMALLQTGKTSERHIADGVNMYSTRIRKYTGFEIITIPDIKNNRNMPVTEQKIREGKKILESVGRDDYIVLLDEMGKEMRTTEFADWIRKHSMTTGRRTLFVTGGPWGVSDEVYKASDFRLSLSKMTFPRQLIRLVFMEQLYRAFTIIKGEPYHHE